MKAKNLLDRKGYKCEIIRTPKNFSSGCGYSIKVFASAREITPILDNAGIKWKDYTY